MRKNKVIGYSIGCPSCECGGLGYKAGKGNTYARYTIWEERKDAVEEAMNVKEITGKMPLVYEVKLTWK